jgi:hypothetical protein
MHYRGARDFVIDAVSKKYTPAPADSAFKIPDAMPG